MDDSHYLAYAHAFSPLQQQQQQPQHQQQQQQQQPPLQSSIHNLRTLFSLLNNTEFEHEVELERRRRYGHSGYNNNNHRHHYGQQEQLTTHHRNSNNENRKRAPEAAAAAAAAAHNNANNSDNEESNGDKEDTSQPVRKKTKRKKVTLPSIAAAAAAAAAHRAEDDDASPLPPEPRKKKNSTSSSRRQQKSFDQRYQELCEFKAQNGHCNVSRDLHKDTHYSLGHWCETIRRKYNVRRHYLETGEKKHGGVLSDEHLERLQKIGFRFENIPPPFSFDERVEQVKQYKKDMGNTRIQHNYNNNEGGNKLGQWASHTRTKYRKNQLSADEVKKLEAIDFDFSRRRRGPRSD